MKRILIVLFLLACAGVLAFRLFEPVFVFRTGWSDLPDEEAPFVSRLGDPEYSSQAALAEQALRASRNALEAPALSAAVLINGETVWQGAAGFADLETRTPVTLGTRFRLGSTSKAVTSVAIATLVDAGKIDLDAPMTTYIKDWPTRHAPFTLAQVMSHRAGIRDYGLCLCFPVWEHLNQRRFAGISDLPGLVAASPLRFEPGTGFAYTSLGYNLAGAALETASGSDFASYLQAGVFAPLGMTASGLDTADEEVPARASFYEAGKARYKPAYPVDNSIRVPSGGLLSTPGDMVRLGAAMLDDRLLSPAVRQRLVTIPPGETNASGDIYALGWRVSPWTLFNGTVTLPSYHHNGTAVGSTSVFVVFPDRGMVVSVMMNKGATSVDELSIAADSIAEAFITP